MEISKEIWIGVYLGLAKFLNGSKTKLLGYIKFRVLARITEWYETDLRKRKRSAT